AAVMQAIAVRAASNKSAADASGGVDPGLVVRLLGQWRCAGPRGPGRLAVGGPALAPARQPRRGLPARVAARPGGVPGVGARWVMGVTLSWREWAAVFGVVAGVGLLGSSAGAEGAAQVGAVFKLALIVAVAGLAVIGLAAAKLNEPYRTTALGLIAGFGYGV